MSTFSILSLQGCGKKDHCCGLKKKKKKSQHKAFRETEIPAQQEGQLGNARQPPAGKQENVWLLFPN